jgi:flagellar hook-associated protein FlgK
MEEEKSNIKDFNTKVNLLILALQARNAPIPDFLNQLFTAYKACGDSHFAKYITTKEDLHMDGTMNYTRPQLMKVAVEKFKTISDKGEWLKKSEEQLQFIAMKAQLQSQLEKLGSNKKPQLKQNAEKPPKKNVRPNTGKWAWKSVPPKAGEANKKTVDGKKYSLSSSWRDAVGTIGQQRRH